MHIIDAHFVPFDKISFSELFGSLGVYVIWSARADVRPSYIGEGHVMHRFANEHVKRFGRTMQGYVAILNDATKLQNKADCEMVESALIYVGEQIDQRPVHNESGGKRRGVFALRRKGHNVLRINVSGYHPLRWDTRISGRQQVVLRLKLDGDTVNAIVEHPWRRVG